VGDGDQNRRALVVQRAPAVVEAGADPAAAVVSADSYYGRTQEQVQFVF
jgi:hypothetical protein